MKATSYPHMYRIQQDLPNCPLPDPAGELRRLLRVHPVLLSIQPGARVAITAGSRGVSNIPLLIAAVVDELRARGAEPFVVPAMGSHGGATAEGQVELLRSLGVTDEAVGAPIRASMEVVELGQTDQGVKVFCDKLAFQSDMIVAINRVKPHTGFRGDIESGIVKMLVIGLGKRHGAEAMHQSPERYGSIPAMARISLEKAPIGLGVAVIEDALHQTAKIALATPAEFEAVDKAMLMEARRLMPQLPVDQLDVLIIDETGKDISGAGMDPNVIGMGRAIGGRHTPEVTRLVVLDITEESHGNPGAIGYADVTTRRLVDKLDYGALYMNSVTAAGLGRFDGCKIPLTMPTDREAIAIALNGYDADTVRLIRIKNTLQLGEMDVSHSLLDELRQRENVRVVGEKGPMSFDEAGTLF